MDGNGESEESGRPGEKDRRRSKDINDHYGLVTSLVNKWLRKGHFRGIPFDEVVHISIIEADRLLKSKYDKSRSSVSSFLYAYLYSRVEYRIGVFQGRRKRPGGWLMGSDLDPPARQREPPPNQKTDFEDLIKSIHPDFQDFCRRIGEGETIDELLTEMQQNPLFNTCSEDNEEITRDDLLKMLRSSLRHIQ